MSNPSDWLQIYHRNLRSSASSAPPFPGESASVPSSDAGAVSGTSVSQPASARLIPDHGRVAKPIRRRSRASRKAPTTLLTTDASNFRAMVQQFTGGPSAAPFALSSTLGQSNFSFGFPQARQPVNPRPIMTPPEFQIPVQQNLFHLQNQQQFMFALNNNNQRNSSPGTYGFPPSLEGSRAANVMGLAGETSLDGISPESAKDGRENKFIR